MHITTTELVTFQKADLIQIAPDRLARLTNAGAKWNARISANNAPFSMQHQDRVLEELKTSNNIAQIVKINQNESPSTGSTSGNTNPGSLFCPNASSCPANVCATVSQNRTWHQRQHQAGHQRAEGRGQHSNNA